MQEIYKALEGWVTHYPNFKGEVLMPGYNGWALPVGFKCQFLPLCRNQRSAKNLRIVSALNWFVLQKDSLHSNSLPRVWMFGIWVGDRASKDPLQISKGQITKCPFCLSFTAIFIHAQSNSAPSLTLALCALIFNLDCHLGTRLFSSVVGCHSLF